MAAHNRRIPEEEDLRKMVAAGFGRRELVRNFGCSPETLRARLKKLHLVARFDTVPRMDPENLAKVIVHRLSGAVSLPAISMFVAAREGRP